MSDPLRPGYKQTEVGVIPEDWEARQIGDLHPFVTSGSRGWATFYTDYGAPFIRITNLTRGSIYLDLSDLRFVNLPAGNSEGVRTQLQVGDVLISITADIGIIGYVSTQVPRPAYINQHIALVRFSSSTDPKFVSYFLASEKPQKLFRAFTDSGAKAGMNLTTVKQIRLALPPTKAEQEAIAEALSDADALIESLSLLLAKKRHLKQGAMQQLLTGKKRLPGFSEEWAVKRLGEIAEIVMGQSPSSAHYNNKGDGLPLIQGNADISNRKTIKRVFTTEVTKRGRRGDILMSVRAPVGEISRAVFDICLGRGVCAIRYPNEFLYHALIAKEPTWAKLSKGSTFDSVNSTDVKAFGIEMPTDDTEQTAIATILSDMDAEITALEEKLAKARALKQGMMQELLTGRIRLV